MTNFRWKSWSLKSKIEALGTEFGDPMDIARSDYHPQISVEYFDDGRYRRVEGDLISYSIRNVVVNIGDRKVKIVGLRHIRDFKRIESPKLS